MLHDDIRKTEATEKTDAARVSGLFTSKRRIGAAAAAVAGSVLVAVPLVGATATSSSTPDVKPVAAEHQISFKPDPGGIGGDQWKPAPPKPAATKAPKSSSDRASRSESRASLPSSSSSSSSSSSKSSGSPKAIAQSMLAERGWSGQYSCLNSLWEKESNWDPSAYNSSSGATGIPQALPGSKMASAGSDWRTNPATQIEWGLGYISETYGTPCAAWSHSQANNWY